MPTFTEPTIRFTPSDNSSPAEAKLTREGSIRLKIAPDVHSASTYFTAAELREFATELLGLADASEAIHA